MLLILLFLYLGSWHSFGCSLTHKTLLNIDSDKITILMATALLNGIHGSALLMDTLSDLDLGNFEVRSTLEALCHVPRAVP